jgi:hypothetical protein
MNTKQKTDGQKRVTFRRAELKALSVKARAHREDMLKKALDMGNAKEVEIWTLIRINEIIAGWYKESSGAAELRTFQQWAKAGYYVERGSKAFTLWGRKRNRTLTEAKDGEVQEHEYDFFPIAYLFSDRQVKPKQAAHHENTATHRENATGSSDSEAANAGDAAANAAAGEAGSFDDAFTA